MIQNFKELEEQIKDCKKCKLCNNRHNIVLGTGNRQAKIMFIGEGPGADEDIQGEPFIVKCRPPQNRNPEQDEIDSCIDYLRTQVMLVKPEIIVLLGSVALKAILGKEYSITSSRGKWVEKKGIRYLPTFHPAALLRDESKKIFFWKDLKEVKKFM